MMRYAKLIFVALAVVLGSLAGYARFNDKVLNRPYADLRRWHLGFSIGVHTEDLKFTHNGIATEDGQTWYMEQPSFSPGFCVNGLFDLRLNNYFNVRVSPGMYFGNRDVRMRNIDGDEQERVNLKSTLVVLPVDVKFSAMRLRNVRPYVTAGFMPAFDVSKKRREPLQLKSSDLYLTVGFGLDTYLPYFKFIPEIKFCFGLKDVLQHDRPDLADDPGMLKYTNALKKATSQMVVLTFYFE
ncbi:MAG: PorT family protein [Muribaculaceae bacterium]|nr:PorT family protein [Muribaculaceae bacterium]MDE6321389.1 PorT family protein [Muribaculaceae bacterium]